MNLIWMTCTFSVFCAASGIVQRFPVPTRAETGSQYWYDLGKKGIEDALNKPINSGKAKNIILFLGDGMGITVSTAGRIYKQQKKFSKSGEEGFLAWEKLPNVALLKTYNLDKQVPDSAGTATAFLTGVKSNYYTLGVNGQVKESDCPASLRKENRLDSILKWAQDAGMDTGFVTTTRVTHATPGALYARSAHREWESDADMQSEQHRLRSGGGCVDIARQLVEEEPGRSVNVVIGGGRGKFVGSRADAADLTQAWREDKRRRGASSAYAASGKDLRAIDAAKTDYILALLAESHIAYEADREESFPALEELVQVALRRLRRSEDGFFLLVEGGRIDHGLHDTKPRLALDDLLAFDAAIESVLKDFEDDDETLVLVTADHSHAISMNGYPDRGNNILGTTIYEEVLDDLPYTTLGFTNGVGFNFTFDAETHKVVRPNLTGVDTTAKDYISLAPVPMKFGYETHSGEDVAVYAQGPMAHLFHGLHEQTHVAHVMAYSAGIGPYKGRKERQSHDYPKAEPSQSGTQKLLPGVGLMLFLSSLSAAVRIN